MFFYHNHIYLHIVPYQRPSGPHPLIPWLVSLVPSSPLSMDWELPALAGLRVENDPQEHLVQLESGED